MKQSAAIEHAAREQYLNAAAYYYYKADGAGESLYSAIQRKQSVSFAQRLEALGVEVPRASEVRERARALFPAEKLHGESK